jgi:endogenous inhibitor of DNA gyrase (YacG/DUF329 family)
MTETPKKAPTCSICGKPVDPAYKPFCSKRCANVDLHRWLKGSYVIAGGRADEQMADEEPASPPPDDKE